MYKNIMFLYNGFDVYNMYNAFDGSVKKKLLAFFFLILKVHRQNSEVYKNKYVGLTFFILRGKKKLDVVHFSL